MSWEFILGSSYVVLGALVLTLNLKSQIHYGFKLASIVFLSILYIATYIAIGEIRGWAIEKEPPSPFKLHWAIVEEPDKRNGTEGMIYILGQEINAYGTLQGQPRLYGLPFSPALAQEIENARAAIEDGKPIEANIAYKAKKVEDEDLDDMQTREGAKAQPDSASEADRLTLNFREIPKPDLPAKPAQ